MKFETILYDVEDEVLTITLNRPERLNAWTRQMLQDLLAAFDVADADDGIGAIVLTGAVERSALVPIYLQVADRHSKALAASRT